MKNEILRTLESIYINTISAKRELFYTGVYNYFELLEKLPELEIILKEEEKILTDRESKGVFVAPPYFRLQSHIYWPIKWFKEENKETPELDFFLNKTYPKNKNLERKYVVNLGKWKEIFSRLHINLTTKLLNVNHRKSRKNDLNLDFKLLQNGKFSYQSNEGSFNISSREYLLLKLLIDNKNEVVKYQAIAQEIFKKDTATKVVKMQINEVVRNVKRKLLILPKNKKYKDFLKNHKNVGYFVEI